MKGVKSGPHNPLPQVGSRWVVVKKRHEEGHGRPLGDVIVVERVMMVMVAKTGKEEPRICVRNERSGRKTEMWYRIFRLPSHLAPAPAQTSAPVAREPDRLAPPIAENSSDELLRLVRNIAARIGVM